MNRLHLRGLTLAAGMAMGLLAATAQALPPVMDRVPADALLVITTPSVDRLERSVTALTSTINLPIPVPPLKDALAMAGFEEGIDAARSIAIVLVAGDMDRPQPPVVVLVPTTDYAALLGNFGVQPTAGVDEGEIDGEPVFFRNIGDGYAIMAPDRLVAEAFTGAAGQLAAHTAALGPSNKAIVDAADLAVVANITGLRPIVGPGVGEMIQEMVENSPLMMMGMMDEIPGLDMLTGAITSFLEQGRSMVLGLKVDANGVALDLGTQFEANTMLAGAFAQGGDTSALLRRLPNQPFYFAMAMDISAPGIRGMVNAWQRAQKELSDQVAAMMREMGEEVDPQMPDIFSPPLESIDGMSMVVGAAPGAMMGAGFLVNSVAYLKSKDPAAYITRVRQNMQQLAGGEASIMTSYKEKAATIEGTQVDSWEVKLDMADADPMAQQAMGAFFGPAGGPNGYIAPAEGGVVQTFSKNSILMGSALKAAKSGQGLGAEPMVAQVGERLAANRFAEGYIGTKPILDMVKPVMAMMGMAADFDVPEQLPPIGMGVGASDGAARATLFIPAPVLKTISEAAQAATQGAGRGPGGPGPRNRSGQPRF